MGVDFFGIILYNINRVFSAFVRGERLKLPCYLSAWALPEERRERRMTYRLFRAIHMVINTGGALLF